VPQPLVTGVGGTVRTGSTSEIALRVALEGAAAAGARVRMFSAAELDLPFYDPKSPDRTGKALELIGALRASDGIIVASPGYHGALSGMIKNALDYVEDMAGDARAYLDGMPFGCIGVAVVAGPQIFAGSECVDTETTSRLRLIGTQVARMASMRDAALCRTA
jgi:FMN reductase